MFIEKYYNPGRFINLSHIIEINWVDATHIRFIMVTGREIIWEYETTDDAGDDLTILREALLEKRELVSREEYDGDRIPRS